MNHDLKMENLLEKKKESRAISLFDYIEKKEEEYKKQRHELLKSIVLKQRVKIAQKESVNFIPLIHSSLLKQWAQHCQKLKETELEKKKTLLNVPLTL